MKWIYLIGLIFTVLMIIIISIATELVVITLSIREMAILISIIGLVFVGLLLFFKGGELKKAFGGKVVRIDPMEKAKEYCWKKLDTAVIPDGLPQKTKIGKDEYYAVKLRAINNNHDIGVRTGLPILLVLDKSGSVVGPPPQQQIDPSIEYLNNPFKDIKPVPPTEIIVERPLVERTIERPAGGEKEAVEL